MSYPDWMSKAFNGMLSGGFVTSSISGGTVSANTGMFASGVTIQGLAVIKDGDPVGMAGSGAAGQVMYTGVSGLDNKWALSVYVVSGSVVGGGGAGSIAGLQSGTMVLVSGGPIGLSGLWLASGINVVASVTTTLAGYQSGTLVALSGGFAGISGLPVTTTVNPFGLQSGTMVLISGGQGAVSGVSVVISGGAFSSNVSGGFTVSGSVQVSGTVAISNTGFTVSGGLAISGVVGISGADAVNWLSGTVGIIAAGQKALGVTASIVVWDGLSGYRALSATSGANTLGLNVYTVSGDQIAIISGGTIPVSVISGAMNISGGVTVSGGLTVSGIVGVSGNVAILSGSLSVSSGIVYVMSGLVNILSGERALDLSGASLVQLIVGASGSHVLQAGLYWRYQETHAGGIVNVQSGASVLHAVVVNSWVSGQQIKVMDSLSGNAGALVATIGPIPASGNVLPQSVIYDAFLMSGLVLVVSGTGSITAMFRNPV